MDNSTLLFQSYASTPMFSRNETLSWRYNSDSEGKEAHGPPLLFETMIFASLVILQGALLHPMFQHSVSARWTRRSLAPLNISWWLSYPFRSAVQSPSKRELVTGFLAANVIFKSIEWGCVSGPYHFRKLKTIDGVPAWEKEPAPKGKSEKSSWTEFVLWTTLLLTSKRGNSWSWGPPAKGNTDSFARTTFEVIRHQLVMLPCVAFILYSQDHTNLRANPTAALLDLGFRPFPGIGLLAECLLSASLMFSISSAIEMISLLLVLPTYLLYPLAKTYGLSSRLTELLLNPVNYPRQFENLFDLSSVSYFWGKSWHQMFRRPFLFCGGKPAMSLAYYMGASEKIQKICGAMGVFALSGLFHEYPLYAFQTEPHPTPRVLFKTFPGTFLFFFVQSFGVILEPFIIPLIPKSLGGGRLWTLSFLFLTAPLFTHDICRPGAFAQQFVHPSEWTWLNFVVPVPLAAKLLRP